MASENHQPGAASSKPSVRARRISDEEWDTHREKLVKLYIEEEASQKEMIDVMANEHNFVITEKQLKHRLQKWNVRKHISSSDMDVILSLKRKRDAQDIKIRGYVLDKDRLERAFKRRKDRVITPPFIPPHITLRSPPSTQISTFAGCSNVNNAFNFLNSNRQNPHSGIVLDAASPSKNWMLDFPPNFEAFDEEPATISHSRLQSSLEVPHSPPKQLAPYSASKDTKFSSRGYTLATPTASNCSHPYIVSNASSTLSAPHEITDSLERFSFRGTDLESIIPQMQLLRSQLFKCKDSRYLECRLRSSGLSKNQLAREITSDWLLSEVDDMLCWSYDVSAKRIRQRRARAADRRSGNQSFSLARYCDDGRISESDVEDVWRGRPAPQLSGKLTGLLEAERSCVVREAGGEYWRRAGIQVELREASKKPTGNHGRQSPYSVILYFIPEGRGPKIGISVAFSRLSSVNQPPRVCPTITTFNVVPEDSEIIICVTQNDLKGVQRLLDERKASTTDVDPGGFSLLYYAIFSGCSEVYLLLLQGGASTQRCSSSAGMAGLIDCIWDHFIQTKFLGAVTSDFSNKYISDFNQCVSMTHVALQHGVDVDQFYHQHPIYANPLFLLRFVTFSETVYEDMSISALLEHLLAAGYEMEEPNCLGQTVLLYAANVCRRRCLHFLKKLISLGANIHAIDKEGRGTLHQALDFGRGLVESYLNIFMRGALLLESEGERNRTFEYHYDPDVPLVDPDDVPSYPLGIKATHAYADYPEEFPDIDYTPGDESEPYDSADYGDDDDFCYVGDYDIDDFTIVKGIEDVETGLPSSRQKTRVRFKLLTLLEAGCDPNLVDKKAASPSDYAQMENLWPQWEWALTQSGYIYDEDKQLWIKDISLSDIVDFASAE